MCYSHKDVFFLFYLTNKFNVFVGQVYYLTLDDLQSITFSETLGFSYHIYIMNVKKCG